MSDKEYERSERRAATICIACLCAQFFPASFVLAWIITYW